MRMCMIGGMLAAALVLAAGNQAHAQGGKLLDRVPTPGTQPAVAGTTRVTIVLVRVDQARETVDAARRGSDEPHYRGPFTAWPFGLTVDGKREFDERDAKGQIVRRLTSLTLDLPGGEHAIDPGGHKFRIARSNLGSWEQRAQTTNHAVLSEGPYKQMPFTKYKRNQKK